jgi:hypothetical protein
MLNHVTLTSAYSLFSKADTGQNKHDEAGNRDISMRFA